jgi:phosphinothricin acetyltransferase
VFPENLASIKLHKRFGFRELGYRENVAQLHGEWKNTLLLERRSNTVGI